MDYIQLISAAGIGGIVGSLLTTLIQAWLSNKQRLDERKFQEKKEAYVGFLTSIAKVKSTPEDAVNAALWSVRVGIVAPENIRKIIHEYKTSQNDQRDIVIAKLEESMRKDLDLE